MDGLRRPRRGRGYDVGELIEALQDYGHHLQVKVTRYVEKTEKEYRYKDFDVADEHDQDEDGFTVVIISIDPATVKVRR